MRLRIKAPVPNSAEHETLVEALAAELRKPQDNRQPIVTEDHRVKKGVIHVQVIWDRWRECPELERWTVIQEAYRRVRGDEFANQVRLATGFTMSEAASIGLLPFQLVPRQHPTAAFLPLDYARALIDEGASVLEDPSNPTLRYESLEEAEAARERLERSLPGSRWSIIQQDPGTQ